jgi:hypothetical protein
MLDRKQMIIMCFIALILGILTASFGVLDTRSTPEIKLQSVTIRDEFGNPDSPKSNKIKIDQTAVTTLKSINSQDSKNIENESPRPNNNSKTTSSKSTIPESALEQVSSESSVVTVISSESSGSSLTSQDTSSSNSPDGSTVILVTSSQS